MIEINEANEVLSDASSLFGEESNDIPPSFDPLDHDWGIALRYYPDLTKLEARLSKISWRLAYSFRAYLLDAKLFDQEPRSLRR